MSLGFRSDCLEGWHLLQNALEPLALQPCQGPEVDVLFSYRVGRQRERTRDFHLLYQGSRLAARGHHDNDIQRSLQHELHLLAGLSSTRHFLVRGAAVLVNEQALLILGPQGSGVSTMAESLVRHGSQPFSDGYLLLQRRLARLETLDGQFSYPVAGILSCRYRRGHCFRPQPLTGGALALEIFGLAPGAALQAQMILSEGAELARRCPAWKGDRPDARAIVPRVLKLFS